jgi:hypothetical protein
VNTFSPVLTGNTITFPNGARGRFLVELYLTRTTTATAGSGSYTVSAVNCSVAPNTGMTLAPNFVATQVQTAQQQVYEVFADGASLSFGNTLAFFGAGTGSTITIITQLPAGLSIPSAILDVKGLNREKNYQALMDMITQKKLSSQRVILETDIFRAVIDGDNSKCWFLVISDPEKLFFLPYEELCLIMGKTDDFVNKFLMEKLCRERQGEDITSIRR